MLACTGPRPVPATPSGAESVAVADRLSNQRVNAFAEDADGHIWIGTFRGLDKYTIHDYHQYFCTDDTLGLPDNQITALRRGTDGRLWIGTAGGAALRTDDGGFLRIPIEGDSQNVNEIIETRDGQILFNCSAQLFRYDAERGCIVPAVRDYGGYNTLVGADGRIWTATMAELRCFEPVGFSPAGSWPTRHPVYHSAMAATGEIWLSGMGELSIFDPRTEKWSALPRAILQEPRLIRGDIDILFACGQDMLLHTIKDGMFCYSQATGQLLHQSDPEFPYDIPDFEIRTLFRDSRGNLWFGSTDQGYSISYAAKNGFNSLPYLTDRFAHKSVTSVCTDREGHLWISTLNDGLFVYDLQTRDLRRMDLNRFVPDNSVGYIRCSSIFCDAQGELWIAMTEKYTLLHCRYDGRELRTVDQVDVVNPVTVSQDDLGRIWIANYTGQLARYDKDTRRTDWATLRENAFGPTVLLQLEPGRMLAATYDTTACEVNMPSKPSAP